MARPPEAPGAGAGKGGKSATSFPDRRRSHRRRSGDRAFRRGLRYGRGRISEAGIPTMAKDSPTARGFMCWRCRPSSASAASPGTFWQLARLDARAGAPGHAWRLARRLGSAGDGERFSRPADEICLGRGRFGPGAAARGGAGGVAAPPLAEAEPRGPDPCARIGASAGGESRADGAGHALGRDLSRLRTLAHRFLRQDRGARPIWSSRPRIARPRIWRRSAACRRRS